jgi:sulfite reductase (ferredoxin)
MNMKAEIEPILRIHETVRQDMLAFRQQVLRFIEGDMSPVAFRAYRVPMGVYEQRTQGTYMVRTRLGAGLALPSQLKRIADLSKAYGNGILHVTTRQALQIHDVSIEDTAAVLEGLLEVGVCSRGGGGNTVRNVTCCARAGLCLHEAFDVTPHTIAVAEYLLQNRSSFNLPRKFKIVFSGCTEDCANASVADLGFFAHGQDGQRGFAVYAAGGLGGQPRVAILLEEFVPEHEIFAVAEAMKRLFDKHGDRSNKRRARLRYVLDRVGANKFKQLYQAERTTIAAEGMDDELPNLRDLSQAFQRTVADHPPTEIPDGLDILPEKSAGLWTLRLKLALGDIRADDLSTVAAMAEQHSRGFVRATQDQNLLLSSVPTGHLPMLSDALSGLAGISINAHDGPSIVSCAGAATCKLGLCLARGLASAISKQLAQTARAVKGVEKTIKISGCPNACGQHYLADIGFQGRARRINGRLMPWYDVLVGGHMEEGRARLAHTIGSVPAQRIPDMLGQAFPEGDLSEERVTALVEEYSQLDMDAIPEAYYRDFGATGPFSLAGRGPGECGAGVMDVVQVDIDQARQAVKNAAQTQDDRVCSEHLYQAVLASARSLLIIFGFEAKRDREVFAGFEKHLIKPGWVKEQARDLFNALLDFRLGDMASLSQWADQVTELTQRVELLFSSLDAGLNFTVEPIEARKALSVQTPEGMIDLRGVLCPLNFVKAKLALERIEIGQVLEVLLDEGEPMRNVPASFAQQGQTVIETKQLEDHFAIYVYRQK